jgi:hypothetical protein
MKPKILNKPSAKEIGNAKAPVPNFITQVSKEDEKKQEILEFLNFYKCCSLILKCIPFQKKRRMSLHHIPEVIPALLEPQHPQFKVSYFLTVA